MVELFHYLMYVHVDSFLCIFFVTDDLSMRHFVKLISATPSEAAELITSIERSELEDQLIGLGEDGASERCFIEAALEELKVCMSLCMSQQVCQVVNLEKHTNYQLCCIHLVQRSFSLSCRREKQP